MQRTLIIPITRMPLTTTALNIHVGCRGGTASTIPGSTAAVTTAPGGDTATIPGIADGMAGGTPPGIIAGMIPGTMVGVHRGMAAMDGIVPTMATAGMATVAAIVIMTMVTVQAPSVMADRRPIPLAVPVMPTDTPMPTAPLAAHATSVQPRAAPALRLPQHGVASTRVAPGRRLPILHKVATSEVAAPRRRAQ